MTRKVTLLWLVLALSISGCRTVGVSPHCVPPGEPVSSGPRVIAQVSAKPASTQSADAVIQAVAKSSGREPIVVIVQGDSNLQQRPSTSRFDSHDLLETAFTLGLFYLARTLTK